MSAEQSDKKNYKPGGKKKCLLKAEPTRLLFNSYRLEVLEWLRKRGPYVLFGTLLGTALLLALAVSVLAWSHFSKENVLDNTVMEGKPSVVKLYMNDEPDEEGFPEIDDDRKDFDPDKPVFLRAKIQDATTDLQELYDGKRSKVYRGRTEAKNQRVFGYPKTVKYREETGRKKSGTGEEELQELTNLNNLNEEERKKKYQSDPQSEIDLVKQIDDKLAKTIDANGELRHSIDSSDSPPPMTLYRVNNAVRQGAVCLDGSSPAYYHRPGTGSSEKLWIIHFNGGAWCFDTRACIERSRSSLGSTKKLPPAPPIIQGINSPDPQVNPDFYDWNLVWVVYCDGASFTGNRERPVITESGETIYMRGKRVLNAIINDLLFNRDFKFAEAIILTGSSAGSMTAIFQADYIASKFPKTIPVRVLSDAGFFIDTAPIGGKNLGSMFKKIYEMQNSSAGLDQDCVHDLGEEDAWQCFMPSKIVKYVKTPLFLLNSAYDVWAMIYFMDIDCKFPATETKTRRKRGVRHYVSTKSDSELDIEVKSKEFESFLMKRSTLDRRKRRDVSGFELAPFFRDVVKTTTTKRVEIAPKTTQKQRKVGKVMQILNDRVDDKKLFNTSVEVDRGGPTHIQAFLSNKNTSKPTIFHARRPVEMSRVEMHKPQSKIKIKHLEFDMANGKPIAARNAKPDDPNRQNKTIIDKNKQTEPLKSNEISPEKSNDKPTAALKPLEVKKSDKDVKMLSTMMGELGEVQSLERLDNISQNMSYSLTKQHMAPVKPPQLITKTNIIMSAGGIARNNLLLQQHMVAVKSTIPKRHHFHERNVSTSGEDMEKYDLERHQQLALIASKRNKVIKTNTSRDVAKNRRSTSIAKEYINILRSDPPECTERQMLDAMKYRGAMLKSTEYFMRLPKSGRYLVSCIDHSLSLFDETWTGVSVGGKTIQQAFGDWFYERGDRKQHNFVDCPYPCNPTCP